MCYSIIIGQISLSKIAFFFPATSQSALAIFLDNVISSFFAFVMISTILIQVILSIPDKQHYGLYGTFRSRQTSYAQFQHSP